MNDYCLEIGGVGEGGFGGNGIMSIGYRGSFVLFCFLFYFFFYHF